MVGQSDTAGAKIELAGVLLHIGNQLLEVVGRDILVDNQELGHRHHHADGLEVLERVIRQLRIQRRVDGQRPAGCHEQGVAIWHSVLPQLGANDGASAGLVVNKETLPQRFGELLRQ